MIHPVIIIFFYLASLCSCLTGLRSPSHTWKAGETSRHKREKKCEGVERGAEWEKHPRAKSQQQKRKKPIVQIRHFHFAVFFPPTAYCTFRQKPEKRTWLYSSLFLSSLETRVKLELVCGQSRTCKKRKGRHYHTEPADATSNTVQTESIEMNLDVSHKTLGDLSQPLSRLFITLIP